MKLFKNKILLLLAFLVSLSVLESCQKIDRDYDEEQAFKVLVLGNSLSRDAFSYAPWIMENVCKGMMLDIEILYVGGVGLNTHISYLNSDSDDFYHDYYTSRTHTWSSDPEVRASDVVPGKDWDLIVFQDGIDRGRNIAKFESDISSLKEYFGAIVPNPHYAIVMNPARPDGASSLSGSSSQQDYEEVSSVASEILNSGLVDLVIPCATAVQHARKMSLDSFGDFGHMSYDGKHLQEGIPCQTDASVVAQSLINFANRSGSIDDCTIKANRKWVNERFIPGKHGEAEDASDVQYELTKYCVRMAMEDPFSLDYIEFKKHYPGLFDREGFLLEAHRGFSSDYPENSTLAFEEAGKSEAYAAIETDVQSTKDGVLVCMHDSSLERTVNKTGAIKDYTYNQLSNFYLTGGIGWKDEYANTLKIPTFEEYLDICAKYGKIPIVELKVLDTEGIKSVISMLNKKGFSDDKYVLTSFSSDNLAIAEKNCDAPLEFMQNSFTDDEIEEYASKKNYTIRPLAENVTKDFVDKCHELGLFVEVWNLSGDKSTATKIINTGIDGGTCGSDLN